jgi:hypothetical protein
MGRAVVQSRKSKREYDLLLILLIDLRAIDLS